MAQKKSNSKKQTEDKATEDKKPVEKKSLFEEFKEFILRGNVVELAVGLTVGTAFTKVVNSLVNNLVMPVIGLFLSGEAFRELYINLGSGSYESLAAAEESGAPVLKYGQLLADLLDFLIIAIVIFAVIQFINRAKRRFENE